jgi:predicted phage baseplate assembly protein
LNLATPLTYSYERLSVTIYGNVVEATHGDTKQEILGSGDPRQANQRFTLKQFPMTHLSAPTPSGTIPTLQIRVNGVLWHSKERIADLGPDDRGYTFQTDEVGKVTVQFGDGKHGHRLPSGSENVRAIYRVGIGKSGNLPEWKITQLISRPLGVREVTNPLPAIGGMDRQGILDARRDTPIGICALDRLVSVSDYEDFARSYVGIAKAHAVRGSDGNVTRIHLTVAGREDATIDPQSDLYRNLVLSLRRFGDPSLPLTVDSRRLRLIVLVASIRVFSDYEFLPVIAAVRERLLSVFSFHSREFGQDVLQSDIVKTIHSVPGVEAIRIDQLGLLDEVNDQGQKTSLEEIAEKIREIATNEDPIPERIPVNMTSFCHDQIRPAEIAYLLPGMDKTLLLNEWKS